MDGRSRISGATAEYVAKHVIGSAQKNDAMAGWIPAVIFHLIRRDLNLGADWNMPAMQRLVGPIIGDYGVGLASAVMNVIRPIRISLTAA